jgi:hypothetical protein
VRQFQVITVGPQHIASCEDIAVVMVIVAYTFMFSGCATEQKWRAETHAHCTLNVQYDYCSTTV